MSGTGYGANASGPNAHQLADQRDTQAKPCYDQFGLLRQCVGTMASVTIRIVSCQPQSWVQSPQ